MAVHGHSFTPGRSDVPLLPLAVIVVAAAALVAGFVVVRPTIAPPAPDAARDGAMVAPVAGAVAGDLPTLVMTPTSVERARIYERSALGVMEMTPTSVERTRTAAQVVSVLEMTPTSIERARIVPTTGSRDVDPVQVRYGRRSGR